MKKILSLVLGMVLGAGIAWAGNEDLTGTDKFIDDFVLTNPDGSTDPISIVDDQIRGVKNVLSNSFPGVTGAVLSTHTELNLLDNKTSVATLGENTFSSRQVISNFTSAATNTEILSFIPTDYTGTGDGKYYLTAKKTSGGFTFTPWDGVGAEYDIVLSVSGASVTVDASANSVNVSGSFTVGGVVVPTVSSVNTLSNKELTSPTLTASPASSAAGQEVVDAAWVRAYAPQGSFEGALVYDAVTPVYANLPSGTGAFLPWDAESYDTNSIHSTVSNTSRLTVPSGVTKVRLHGKVVFSANPNGVRYAAIYKNGSPNFVGFSEVIVPAASGVSTIIEVSSPVLEVVAGNYFELYAYQDSSVSINVNGGINGSWFSLEVIQ